MQRVTWAAAATLFATVCVGGWAYTVWQDRDAAIDLAEQQAVAVAHLLANHVSRVDATIEQSAETAPARQPSAKPEAPVALVVAPDGHGIGENLKALHRQAHLHGNVTLTLLSRDGAVLAQWPPSPRENILTAWPGVLDAEHHFAEPNPDTAVVRRNDRLTVYRRLPERPIIAAAEVSLAPSLAAWRDRTLWSGLLMGGSLAGFALIAGTGLSLARRERRKLREQTTELTQRRNDLQLIADSVPALIGMIDTGETFRFANQHFEHWIGSPPFEGRTIREMLGERTYAEVRGCIRAALEGAPVCVARWVAQPNGDERFLETTYIPRRGADGRVLGVYVFAVDVTERRRMEERLRHSEERLREAHDIAGLGHWEYDIASRRISWSPELYRIFGRDPAQGPPDYAELRCLIHPHDRPAFDDCVAQAVRGHGFESDWRFRRPDGSYHWKRTRARPYVDSAGRVTRIVGTDVDITERKRAEEALRHSEERYRLLFSRMTEGFALCEIICDEAGNAADYRFLQVNPAFGRLTGIPPDDVVVARTARELGLTAEPEWIETLGRVALNGEPVRREHHVNALDRWYDVHAFNAGPGRFAILFVDITERKQAEKRQALLTAELDHRVRNILASVQSMVQMSAHGATTKDEYANILYGRIATMARAHGLLTQRGWQGAGLATILGEELAPFSGHGDSIVLNGDPDVALKPKTALNVALIVHELTTNAVKYGALSVPGGRVSVRWQTAEDDGNLRLRLQWQEAGGPPVGKPTRRGFGSTLIEAALDGVSGSRVDLVFDPCGVHCTIEVPDTELLLVPAEASEDAEPGAEPARPRAIYSAKVLLVEDESIVRLALERRLREAGLRIIGPAARLEEALALVRRETPGVALLDINVNNERIDPLADLLVSRGVPIIFVTGYEHAVLPERLKRFPRLQKPVTEEQLFHHLQELLGDTVPPSSGRHAMIRERPSSV